MSQIQNEQQIFSQQSKLKKLSLLSLDNSLQNQNDCKNISIESSEEFQNIEINKSQNLTDAFVTFAESSNQSQLIKTQRQQQINQQRQKISPNQSILSEVPDQTKEIASRPEQPQSQADANYQKLVSQKIFSKKINDSLEFKNNGNNFFKSQDYQMAIKFYSQGLKILDPNAFYGATQAECSKMAEVSASLLFNIGSCYFNSKLWKQAVIYFNETLIINRNHIKALYKRAVCRYQLQNYQEAMADIKLAFNKDKTNAEIHKSYQKILEKYNQKIKKDQQHMKELSSRIFKSDSRKSLTLSQKDSNEEQKSMEFKQHQEKQSEISNYIFGGILLGAVVLLGGLAINKFLKK